MFGLQPIHIVLIIVVAVLIFGPKKLPEFGKSLGKGIREFKHATKEMTEDFKSAVEHEDAKPAESKPKEPRQEHA